MDTNYFEEQKTEYFTISAYTMSGDLKVTKLVIMQHNN